MYTIAKFIERIKFIFLLLIMIPITSSGLSSEETLACEDGYTTTVRNIVTSGRNDSGAIENNLFDLNGEASQISIKRVWTWDGSTHVQDKEQFKVMFFNSSSEVVGETVYTHDINNEDGVNHHEFSDLGTTSVPKGTVKMKLVHRAHKTYGDNLNYYNSVTYKGMCYKVDKVEIERPTTGARCYALTDDSNSLHEFFVNPNGNPLPSAYVVSMDRKFNGEGSAYRSKNKTLYAFKDNGDFSDLYGVNVTTGLTSKIISNRFPRSVEGAEFYKNPQTGKDILYIISKESNSKLYAFHADTWQSLNNYPKSISGDITGLDSLALDPQTGKAYAVNDYNYDDKAPKLYEIDLQTGKTTYKVTLGEVVDAEGLSFASDGNLYVEDEREFDGRKLYKINLQNGDLTPSADFSSTSGDMESLSCNGTAMNVSVPKINIETATNSIDADVVTGPNIYFAGNVKWTYVVKNIGNVALTDVKITDDRVGDICTVGVLAVGESKTCSKSSTAVSGQYKNVGTTTGLYNGTVVQDTDPTHYIGGIQPAPAINLEKSTNGIDADTGTGPSVEFNGDVTWSYVVKNTGNVALKSIVVTDDKLGQICTVDSLGAGASKACTKSGKAVSGQYENTGTVVGFNGTTKVQDIDKSHYLGGKKPVPAINIEKSTNGQDADIGTGPTIEFNGDVTWTYVVKNIGNVVLSNVVVSDNKLGQICTVATLAVNGSKTCTKSGKAISGQYENIGTATGISPQSVKVEDTDKSHYLGEEKAAPAIDIEKATNGIDADTGTGPSITFNGDVTWTYVVKNKGNVALTNVVVKDNKLGQICTVASLAAKASKTCTKTGKAIEGQYENIGTVTAEYKGQAVKDTDKSHYIGGDKPAPAIDIEKATNGEDADTGTGPSIEESKAVTWTYVVKNIGNVALTNVVVKDDKLGQICTVVTLAVNGSKTCTKAGIATVGQYTNIGTVTATHEAKTVSDTDTSHYLGEEKAAPAVNLEKSTNGIDADTGTGPSVAFNSDVTWSYVVKNIGNVSLKNIVVTDDKLGEICKVVTLAVNASKTCTKSGKAIEGQYVNIGTVVAFHGTKEVKNTDKSHYIGDEKPVPTIDIETSTNGSDADTPTGPAIKFGDAVEWTYVVKNTGNVDLTGVKVTDSKIGAICTIGALASGASQTCKKSKTAIDGQYSNIGTVTGKYNESIVKDTDPTHYIGGDKPAATIEIETATNGSDADNPSGPEVKYDGEIKWTYVVKNTGNVDLTEVKVTDSKVGEICTIGALAIGDSKTCSKSSKALEGQYSNIGTVRGKYNTEEVTDTDPTHYIGGDKPTSKIEIETKTNGSDADKPTGPSIKFGDTVEWLYIVKNTGTVDLTDVKVVDSKVGEICTIGALATGASETCKKSSEAIEGQYSNIGTVTGKYNGVEIKDTDPTHYIGDKEVTTPPHANDDVKSGESGKPVTLNTVANDTSTDSELNPKSVVLTHGDTTNDGKKLVVKDEGIWTVNPDTGDITFTPNSEYTDDPTPVRYTVEDLNTNVSNEAVETINYPQTKPKANDDEKIGERCKAVSFNILTNDIDAENDINTSSVELLFLSDWLGTDSDSDGDVDTVVVADEGKWVVTNDGLITYTPSNDCSSNPTKLRYTVEDKTGKLSNKAIVTVTYPDAQKSSLGNLVWFDADKNGRQDDGESGIVGVTVELYNANDELNATTVTDENGTYSFINLDAGEYTIKFVVKDGYSITLKNEQNVSLELNSDASIENGITEIITLSEGTDNIDIDTGMYIIPKPSIKIVKTTNGGNVVNILVGEVMTWTYVITNTGNETLTNLVVLDDKEGEVVTCDASLDFLNPTKSISCTKTGVAILGNYSNTATVTAKDSNANSVEDEDSSSYVGNDAPVLLGSIGNYVWLDSDRNGIQNTGEIPLGGVVAQLFNSNNILVKSVTTDASGKYLFEDIVAGQYYVKFTVPSGYSVTKKLEGTDRTIDSDASTSGKTAVFTLVEGENILDIDLGLSQTLTNLGDKVFLDKNANGIQDADETSGVANVLVKLYREDNTLVDEVRTTSTGQYLFRNLIPANYYVHFDVPNNYKVSPQNQGANESDDSDADASGKTNIVTLIAGQDNKAVDMGLYQEAIKLGDRVFYDINKNGIQDAGETGISDVTVNLFAVGTTTPLRTTNTSASGIYLFENVEAGEYYIVFTKPVGYTITKRAQGTAETDSNPDVSGRTENFTLTAGTQDSTIDMGVYQDVVSFGDRVFLDTNHNGLQDLGEKGVRDVNVTIYSANSDFSRSMLTDENGNYLFTHLAAGEYSAEFRDIPYGHLITEKDANNNESDLNDSDAFLEDEKIITEVALLTAGKNDLSWDLGIYKTVCLPGKSVLGNLVFEDFNKDGIQDVGEPGVADITVTLFNNDTDTEVSSTTTDENGLYEFAHVDPEFNYYLQFVVPTGFVVSPQDQDNDTIDSDADETGKTEVIVLEADQINSTVDMGIYREGSIIGDRVFFDELNGASNGIQDLGEQGANDIKVTLYRADGTELKSTRTNVSGEYHFTNIPKGRYTIGFSELPEGYVFASAQQGTDSEKDSDVNVNGRTNVIVVDGKVNITSIDAGLKKVSTSTSSNDIKPGVTGQNVTLDILANDAEGTFNFDVSSVRITTIPEGATLSEDGRTLTVPNEGVWRVNPDTGAITFTPVADFVGDPTAIAYIVQDTQGNESGADIEVNYPPLAVNDNVNAQVGTQVIVYVVENDGETSSPLDVTSIRLIDPTTGDEVETLNVEGEGTWSINIDGSVTFTPDVDFVNNPTAIEYVVREVAGDVSNRAVITIIYPDAVDDTIIVPVDDTAGIITVNVAENDSSNIVASTVTIGCIQPGVDTLVVNGEGTWTSTDDGAIIFTPEADFIGEPKDIEYTIGLVSGERSNCATVDIRRELLVVDDSSILNVGGVTLINILSNDFGSLNAESVQLVLPATPVEGLTLSTNGRVLTVPNEGIWSVNDLGIVSFTSEEGFSSAPTTIRYTVENNNGLVSNVGNIILTEGGVSVVANDDTGIANAGNPIIIDILANDTGDLNSSSVRIIAANGDEVLTLVVPSEGTWTVGDDGRITFTGEIGFVGTPTPIRYVVSDNSIIVLSDTAHISVNGTCDCRPYETSIPVMGQLAALIMLILTLMISMFFLKEEKHSVKKCYN